MVEPCTKIQFSCARDKTAADKTAKQQLAKESELKQEERFKLVLEQPIEFKQKQTQQGLDQENNLRFQQNTSVQNFNQALHAVMIWNPSQVLAKREKSQGSMEVSKKEKYAPETA